MSPGAGRDQLKPMRRIVRLMMTLDNAGRVGVLGDRLIEVGGYGDSDPVTQLGKDLKHLRKQGWQIDNIAGQGEPARYRMVSCDNRLRLALSPVQVAALQRAMILADRADLAKRLSVETATIPASVGSAVIPHDASVELSLCMKALRVRSRLRFRYLGTQRLAHPASVRFQNGQWYFSAVEDADLDSGLLKHFVVSRMSDPTLDVPGSAEPLEATGTIPLHPLLWEVDAPTQVKLRAPADYVPDVVRLLREPDSRSPRDDGDVDMTYTVTHRAALRSRLYALGNRVRLVSPDDVRDELLTELQKVSG